ncbi:MULTISPECIES: DNA double-strand break repair nuclease NurA [Fischerella]|uniref:DNA double-strand break repair nuclease NurA n=1 Tax=Fischerella TaxID=1190 RepID=UPI0004746036|nr:MULTISPECIES: DNA double-strand break repair nuclease NurA [Fischerella]MBD2430860.1 DNA double-strand break repair nuclease NurA [Fischerella sp. FACHB-380]
MLDLTKLTRQMQGLSQHLTQEAAASRQRLELAQQHFLNACDRQEEFVQKQEKWRDRILFASATPVEPLNTCIEIPVPPKVHTVIATDGSQIAPNHHEIAYCYLLNIGRVVLHYGQNKHPLLDSLPEIFYRPEDLYISRQWGIRTEEWMSYCRTASEATVLAELACSVVSKDKEISSPPTPPTSKIPTLAMVDGSLIYWFLEQLPFDARDRILPPILQAWRQMRDAQIPLMGYLSASRNIEAMNFLRLLACPHPVPDCMSFCPNQLEKVPCKVFEPLRDTTLWTTQLKPGQRGPLWRSNARILDLYEDLQIYFCYVHVGAEIARIEIPAWVAENTSLFDESLGLMLAQVQKGYGYPVAIAEAHNQAVVRGGDKARFFALLERQMIKAGLRNVGTSYKEARKRGSIA